MRAGLSASTVTPTRTPPDSSFTTPRRPPVEACAQADAAAPSKTASRTPNETDVRSKLFMTLFLLPDRKIRSGGDSYGLREQFVNGPGCLIDGDVRIRRGTRIGIRNRDSPERPSSDFVRGFPSRPVGVVQRVVFVS